MPFHAFLLAFYLTGVLQPQPGFRIAGRVVRHLGDDPVRHARVSISMVENPDKQISCISGENGDFLFTDLPAAKYTLQVTDHGWSQLFQQQSEEYSTAIAVGPGLESEHIVFPLDSPASISGSVMDDGDDAVSNATVYLFGQSLFRGIMQTGLKTQTNTSTTGIFRFGNLVPGTYYIAVVGRPWYAQNPQPESSELDVAYPVTYYAGAVTADGATPINLNEGAKAEVQIMLHAVPALHIALDGVEKQPEQQIQAMVSQIGPGGSLINIPASTINSEVLGLAPGNYILSAHLWGPGKQTAFGSQTIDLAGDSTIHLNSSVKTSIAGKVIYDGAIPANLVVWMRDIVNGNSANAMVSPDGSFETEPQPGRYAVLLANTPELYMRNVTVKGGTYANGVLTVVKGAQLTLTITAARGLTKIDGVALKDNKPIGGAMVVLLPQDLGHGAYIPRDQSDSDGTFTLNSIQPGRYTLIAIQDGHGLAYADPTVMAPYLKTGRVIDVPLPIGTNVGVEVQQR